jgi:CDP-diacylglycerol--serine O-phosphatidyltransferase
MLHYLKDTANAVTAVGIVCSGATIGLALNNQYEFAVAVALWAIVADDIDGEIARRSSGGAVDTKAIGKSPDGFSDLIFGSVIPAIIICSAIENAFLSTCFGAFLLLVGSLRLNYFDHFGLNTEGYSTGLPLSYDLPILAFILIIHRFVQFDLGSILAAIFIPLTALHVLPFTIRASGPIVHFFTIACCIGGSGVLVLLR